MPAAWAEWEHVVKIDPDKSLLPGETFADVCATGTDAIEIGGTTGMTAEKMAAVVEACVEAGHEHDVPVYIEPSHVDAVVYSDELDGYFVPIVFNAGDVAWITGLHKEWARGGHEIDWADIHTEAYIVLNPDSSVATYTQADCELDPAEVAAYAEVAERLFGQELVYLEYSGTYGDLAVVAAASAALSEATLFYGGGIHDYDSAHEMAGIADTVIVGDLVHDEGCEAVRETVRGAKAASE